MTNSTDKARWAYVFPRSEERKWRAEWVLTPAVRDDDVKIVVNRPCKCGRCLGEIFSSWRYGSQRGPGYRGSVSLSEFSGWVRLVDDGVVSPDERDIMIAMSSNEGNMDAVQAYDSEALTAGAMQKTINPQGYGEFPVQVASFKNSYPKLYETMFVDCGWTVQEGSLGPRMYYKGATGTELKSLIRQDFEEKFEGKRASPPLNTIVHAISSREFQDLQVTDFITRLRHAIGTHPRGYDFPISAYLQSNLGRALVLDHHINRPAYVSGDFAEALDRFFSGNPSVPDNPSHWDDSHDQLEAELLEIYAPNRRMTDPVERYQKLKAKL